MLAWWRRLVGGEVRARIADAVFDAAFARVTLAHALDGDARLALRAQVERFLATRAITAAGGLELTEPDRIALAVLACLPIVHRPFEWLGHWHEVIVYPGQFRVRRRDHDEDSSVVTEWDDDLSGEAWSHGPVVLSWADVEQDLAEPREGFNVVIHEIAHKLDMADGTSDGIPPLSGAQRRQYKQVMQAAFDAHVAAVDADPEGEHAIDPYAAEAPDEFFAVTSEYYFSAPELLRETWPGVFAALREVYGPAPAASN